MSNLADQLHTLADQLHGAADAVKEAMPIVKPDDGWKAADLVRISTWRFEDPDGKIWWRDQDMTPPDSETGAARADSAGEYQVGSVDVPWKAGHEPQG